MATPAAADIRRLRRMVNEPDGATYLDADLQAYIERYPLLDSDDNAPDETDWAGAWDLHAAAADVWEEKAAIVAQDYDINVDGGNLARSQVYAQCMKQARFHRSRRRPGTMTTVAWPKETTALETVWIGNQAELD